MGWVPVDDQALAACTTGAEMGLVVDLYRRARALDWREFEITERSLMTKHNMGNTRIRQLLSYLEEIALLKITQGKRGQRTRLKLVCPTKQPVKQSGKQRAKQEKEDSKGHNGERKAAGKAANKAGGKAHYLETREEGLEETKTTPSNSPTGENRIDRAAGIFLAQMQEHGAEGWDADDPKAVRTIASSCHDLGLSARLTDVEQAIRLARAKYEEHP